MNGPAPAKLFTWGHSLLAAVALCISLVFQPQSLPHLPLCWFREMTGLPCPACGLTRAFCAIGHADFSSAWRFHPFGFLFYGLAIVLLFGPLIQAAAPNLEERIRRPWVMRTAVGTLVGSMLVFGVLRLAHCA